jgi:hypothetical protein
MESRLGGPQSKASLEAVKKKKVKLSLLQAVEAYRVVRC